MEGHSAWEVALAGPQHYCTWVTESKGEDQRHCALHDINRWKYIDAEISVKWLTSSPWPPHPATLLEPGLPRTTLISASKTHKGHENPYVSKWNLSVKMHLDRCRPSGDGQPLWEISARAVTAIPEVVLPNCTTKPSDAISDPKYLRTPAAPGVTVPS